MGIKAHNYISKMSSVAISKKVTFPTVQVHKQTRKARRHEKEVAQLREQAKSILPATTFKRIVAQSAAKFSEEPLRFNSDAIVALQSATEHEMTTVFSGAAFCAEMAKRDTITVEDMRNFLLLRELK
jgi:histone H3/H4